MEAEEVAQAAKAAEGLCPLPRRAYRHQMFGERHNRMCCEGWCPLAAVSVQDTLPHRPQVFRVRDVASCDVGQLCKPPKSTQDQAPTKASAVEVGFPRRSEPQDTLPRRHNASNLVDCIMELIDISENPIICGFSFGGLIAGHLSYQLISKGIKPKKLILVGPGGLGAKRGVMEEMIARHSKMTESEVYNAHKRNLEILMMSNPEKVDDLSIHIQKQNTDAHRIKSRPISGTDTLAQILKQQNVPLYVVWGGKDASVGAYLEDRMAILRSINSEVHFHVEFKLGHWLMYEDEKIFNELFQKIIQV